VLVDRAVIDLPALQFNGVFRAKLPAGQVADVADETLRLARARGVPVAWRVTLTSPPDTAVTLEALGWHAERQVPVMVCEVGPAPSPLSPSVGVTVEEVTAGTLADWSRVVAVSFGCPEEFVELPASYDRDVGLPGETPLRRLLVRADDEPVASSALLPGPIDSGLAGIFCVGTLPHARGKGFGALATQAAMTAARGVGARVAVLQASEMGRPLYERLGFDTVGHISVHLPPTTDQA